MVDFTFELPVKQINRFLNNTNDQINYAVGKASNSVAFDIRRAEQETAKKVFKRPKPQTIRNFFVLKAKKSNNINRPLAKIIFDQIYNKGGHEYMLANVEGGGRPLKRSERRLGSYWRPTKDADLDAYGNIRGRQVIRILSQLRLFNEAGFTANATRTTTRRKKQTYYAIPKVGVFERKRGEQSKKVLNFIAAPGYKKIFPFYEVATKEFNKKWDKQFNYWFSRALKLNNAGLKDW
jgi:hypothetical protein